MTTMLKRYELLSPIGTGGMGRVYRARIKGPKDVTKLVAVKVMHPHLADDPDFVSMFLDEMRVAMALDHRNIVKTFDADHVDESYFMVMELVEGCSLRQLLANVSRRGALLPLDVAVFVGMEISAALEFAHRPTEGLRRGGVLHRDVSPSNILLASEGDVKLADFGVAKAAGGRYVTSANLVRGKRQYMSPEQARGEAAPRSDLYALGAVLYETTTGLPIPRPSVFEGLQSSTLPASPKTIRRDMPDELAALILRCLEPDAEARISSAAELRRGLASVAFELQGRAGALVDPHASLRLFLEQHATLPKKKSGEATVEKKVEGLAAAVLEQVRAVETDPDFSTASTPPLGPEVEGERVTRLAQPLEAKTTELDLDGLTAHTAIEGGRGDKEDRTHKKLWLIAVLLLVASAAAGMMLYKIPSHTQAQEVARSPDHALGLAPDLALEPTDTRTPSDLASEVADSTRPTPSKDAGNGAPEIARTKKPRRGKKRAGYGSLDINSVPWSRVYIDGRLRGETPLQRVRLRAGRHRIRLVSRQHKKGKTYWVSIKAGERLSKVYELPAK